MKEWLRINGKERGWIEGDTFYSVRTQKHFFYKFGGWGASTSILSLLQENEIENFVIILIDGLYSKELKCKVVDFYKLGNKFIDKSEGFEDPQMILPLEFFNNSKKIIEEKQIKLWTEQ